MEGMEGGEEGEGGEGTVIEQRGIVSRGREAEFRGRTDGCCI